MSALAKALLSFKERGVTVHYDGFVQVPEAVWEKFSELARRELTPEDRALIFRPSAPRPGGTR